MPDEFKQIASGLAGYTSMAVLARILWHQRQVRLGQRRFWSTDLIWELPTSVFCAVLGGGVADYASVTGWQGYAIVGAVSWLGPRGIESLLAKVVTSHLGKGPPDKTTSNTP